MTRARVFRRRLAVLILATGLLSAISVVIAIPVAADDPACTSGAHTLSLPGSRVYPEMGNGGYTSLHTDVYISYDTFANLFLPGTHADLTIQATQCLTDFSFDFERTAVSGSALGPNMAVGSVLVNGSPATFAFVQPTYPGDPNGQNDPDPLAHAVSNVNPVSATNLNPPACSPQVGNSSQNGTQCPANKLVITPAAPIPSGETITVTINYTGRPGVHNDGDGTTEGWFRVDTTAAPNDGGFVTTEPVGNMAWMPLNNHPTAKPTYDIYDTVPIGKTAIAAGELVGSTPGSTLGPLSPTAVLPPDTNFPGGSWLWHWHSPERVASYLIGNSIGSYDLLARTSTISGIQYFQAQASAIAAARKALNKIAMDSQEDLTTYQTRFAGPFPFTTDGVIVGIPPASFEEEMQTKITFAGGSIGGGSGTNIGTLAHENFHQWFGDNVSEAAFNLTFWKEGWATIGEYLLTARTAANAAGGLDTPAGNVAFDTSLINRFNSNYGTTSNTFWNSAPSNPTVGNLFSTSSTYTRPGTAYLALRQILDASAGRLASDRWIGAMKQIQSQYGGGSITEGQLEAVFHEWLPNQSAACSTKLDSFFTQWFDTPYPGPNTPSNKPQITGPGINGPDHFYDDASACTRAEQSITFDPIGTRAYLDADFAISPTASSGLPVSLAASGYCTINPATSPATVHIVQAGSCTITASQAGDGVFKQATDAPNTFTIDEAQIASLAPLHAWVSLKNGDDVGTKFDVRVELQKNGTTIETGLLRCVSGVGRNPAGKVIDVPWTLVPGTVDRGDILAVRVSTRVGTNIDDTKCAGHNSAIGLRLYYDATGQASGVSATIGSVPVGFTEYLRSDGNACKNAPSTFVTNRYLDPAAPTATAAMCKDSTTVNFAGGNPYKEIGTWGALGNWILP